eukprot:UN06712
MIIKVMLIFEQQQQQQQPKPKKLIHNIIPLSSKEPLVPQQQPLSFALYYSLLGKFGKNIINSNNNNNN